MPRDLELRVRMTPDEMQRIRGAADRMGLTVSAWVRHVLIRSSALGGTDGTAT